MTEDLNSLDTSGLDKDFIIKEKLDAAGIEVPQEETFAPEEVSDPDPAAESAEHTEEKEEPMADTKHSDDVLLREIDAFRQKAETIQSMIRERESRVSALEEELRQKEAQNIEMKTTLSALESELERKHQEADGLVTNVETQVDRVLGELRNEMNGLSSVSESVEGMKTDLYDKVHNENVKVYRNIQGLLEERDKQDNTLDETRNQFKKMGSKVMFTTVLLVLNLGVGVAILLMLLGII